MRGDEVQSARKHGNERGEGSRVGGGEQWRGRGLGIRKQEAGSWRKQVRWMSEDDEKED